MMRRRNTLAAALTSFAAIAAAALIAAAPPRAQAGDQWSEIDPVQIVVTASGAVVPVFVTNGAPSILYVPELARAHISHTTQPVEGGQATLVTVTVIVPNDSSGAAFPTRSVVSSGPGGTLEVYASTTGTSGQPMTMRFKLPIG